MRRREMPEESVSWFALNVTAKDNCWEIFCWPGVKRTRKKEKTPRDLQRCVGAQKTFGGATMQQCSSACQHTDVGSIPESHPLQRCSNNCDVVVETSLNLQVNSCRATQAWEEEGEEQNWTLWRPNPGIRFPVTQVCLSASGVTFGPWNRWKSQEVCKKNYSENQNLSW